MLIKLIIKYIILININAETNIILTNQLEIIEKELKEVTYKDLLILDLYETLIVNKYKIFSLENKKNTISYMNKKENKKKYKELENEMIQNEKIEKLLKNLIKKDVRILAISNKKYKTNFFKSFAFQIDDKNYIDGIFYYSSRFNFKKISTRIIAQYKKVVILTSNKQQAIAFIKFCNENNFQNIKIVLYQQVELQKTEEEIKEELYNIMKS